MNTFEVSLPLVTSILAMEDGSTVLRTETDAWARPRSTRGSPIQRRSLSELENRIFASASRQVGGSG